ncbi:protein-disulfide reductase DsbD N-terminal domain-containing protein [Pedobacter jeongneungensis]|uniref:protein-disulfide reductase DsbD N-terminal domain-containing protein n=1 Tax=Pedobacter jeongneungensis TaxID=947309 RepID=UPI0004693CA0|nr:protein-disulfide reductase DsbD N-terminal domain-containing protein [Pedobacter jeongneungensis]
MKKILMLCCFAAFFGARAYSQILKPVTWSYAAKRTSPNEATLYLKATIDQGWHIYSQFVKDGGPVKTTFTFTPSKSFSLIGKTSEPKPVTKFESTFKMNVSYFENTVVFQQKVKLSAKGVSVKGKVEYMVCDDSQCLPPEEVEFSILVK